MLHNLLDLIVDPVDTYWKNDPSLSSFFPYLETILIFAIIGIAILVATITILVVLTRRKKRKKAEQSKKMESKQEQPK